MNLLRHTRFLLLVVAFAVFLVSIAMAPGLAGGARDDLLRIRRGTHSL